MKELLPLEDYIFIFLFILYFPIVDYGNQSKCLSFAYCNRWILLFIAIVAIVTMYLGKGLENLFFIYPSLVLKLFAFCLWEMKWQFFYAAESLRSASLLFLLLQLEYLLAQIAIKRRQKIQHRGSASKSKCKKNK